MSTPRLPTILVLGLALSPGCREVEEVDLRSPEAWGSAIVLTGTPEAPVATAFALRGTTRTLEVRNSSLEAGPGLILFYRYALDTMGLVEGPLPRATAREEGRPLLAPDSALALARAEGRLAESDATETATEHALFLAFRLPALEPEACLEAAGCPVDGSGGQCVVPCPSSPPPQPPMPVARPRFDCGPWPRRTVAELGVKTPELAGVEVCDPGPILPCAAGDVWTPDEGCRPALEACEAWAAGLPAEAIYVRPGGAGPGQGSATEPYTSIHTALIETAGRVGRRILALAPALYVEDLVLEGEIELRGCRSDYRGTLQVAEGQSIVSQVRWGAGSTVQVAAAARLDLAHATFDGASGVAAEIWGASTWRRVRVDLGGGALHVREGGVFKLEESQLSGDVSPAVVVAPGGSLEVRDSAISGKPTSGTPVVLAGGRARLERVRLETAFDLEGAGLGFVSAADAVLDEVSFSGQMALAAFYARDSARVTLTGFRGFGSGSLLAAGDAVLRATDLVLVGQRVGIVSVDHVQLTVERALFAGNEVGDTLNIGGSTVLDLADTTVADSKSGLYVDGPVSVNVRRFEGLDLRSYGVGMASTAARMPQLSDLILRRGAAQSLVIYNTLFLLDPQAPLSGAELQRVHISDGSGVGMWLTQRTQVAATDVLIERIRPATPEECAMGSYAFFITVCGGEAVRFASASAGSLRSFQLRDARRGLTLASAGLKLAEGRVEACEAGLTVSGDGAVKPAQVLDRVTFTGNEKALVVGISE